MPRFFLAAFLLAANLTAQTAADPIAAEIKTLRSLPDDQRGAKTGAIALEIRGLPAGVPKISLAYGLANRATEGDPGRDNLQAVTTTLAQSLAETPVPDKDGQPAAPYMEVARLARYEGMTVTLDAPAYQHALGILAEEDAAVNSVDFTLTDLKGKPWKLSELRGKVVVVNFWATWCPPCRKELPDLDALYKQYSRQGLVILGISDEDAATVNKFFTSGKLAYPVLLDPGHAVGKQFNVEGIPHTFVFGRDGKLAAQSIDMRTRPQFVRMLATAGIKTQ